MTERSARILLHPISSQQWNAIDVVVDDDDDDDVSNDDDEDVGEDDAESSRQINWL